MVQQSIFPLDCFYNILKQNIEAHMKDRYCYHLEITNDALSFGLKTNTNLSTQFHRMFPPPVVYDFSITDIDISHGTVSGLHDMGEAEQDGDSVEYSDVTGTCLNVGSRACGMEGVNDDI